MLIAKLSFLSAAVLLPFTASKGQIRGDRAYEPRLPSLLPVEACRPLPESASEDSPRGALPLATPNITRLNAIERVHNAKKPVLTRVPLPPADTAAFISWLRENKEFGEMAQRRLLCLYSEFCERAFEPVSTGRLMRQLGEQGVIKRRIAVKVVNGKYHSPTVYRVLPIEQERAAA